MSLEMYDRITLKLETGSDEDRAFLRRLFCSLDDAGFLQAYGAMADTLVDMQLLAREQQYRAQYPDGRFQLILLDGEPIGRFATDRNGDAWTAIDVALLPQYRGHAIGTRLMESLLRDADAAGRPVRACVRSDNTRARELWLSLGFEPVEQNLDHWSLLYSRRDAAEA
ncbi:MAG: GNAT family N-acetyltransferase [Planctomycetota bacterium]|jgi:ribosomal protein S18 acetylase RimI-like enzyme